MRGRSIALVCTSTVILLAMLRLSFTTPPAVGSDSAHGAVPGEAQPSSVMLNIDTTLSSVVVTRSRYSGNPSAKSSGGDGDTEGVASSPAGSYERAAPQSTAASSTRALPRPLTVFDEASTERLALQLEGSGRFLPLTAGPCSCVPPRTTGGRWSASGGGNDGSPLTWVPDDTTEIADGNFTTIAEVVELARRRRLEVGDRSSGTTTAAVRILLIGDSIARYLMCFIAKLIARELAGSTSASTTTRAGGVLEGCEPEQSRGAHFLLWPPAEVRHLSPILLQYVSDFYFPESHVSQNLALMEEEEQSWMAPPDVVIVSRGTWDAWIRMPRATAGRHMFYGFTAGIVFLRQLYPNAEIVVYGLSEQYPSRYHKHSERCAMQSSVWQIRSLAYCSARAANAEIEAMRVAARDDDVRSLRRFVRYVDFYPMTHADKDWHGHTMNSDGMHYIGPHEQPFARYTMRTIAVALRNGNNDALRRSTPPPLYSRECTDDHLALNTMPHQKKLRNPARAKGSKRLKDCGLWLAERYSLLDFHKSFVRMHWKNITPAIRFSDCVFYHKASAQRLGGVDLNWPSSFADSYVAAASTEGGDGGGAPPSDRRSAIGEFDTAEWQRRFAHLRNLAARVLPLRTPLWDRWSGNSSYCMAVERSLGESDLRELDRHIDAGVVPCGHRIVYTLRASRERRRQSGFAPLLRQNCDQVRKNRDL